MDIQQLQKKVAPEIIVGRLGNVFYVEGKAELLTLEQLDEMEPCTTIAMGYLVDSPDSINLAYTGRIVRWIASRGVVNDWCIYAQNPHYGQLRYSFTKVTRVGNKVVGEHNIRKIIPCDDEAFSRYRT